MTCPNFNNSGEGKFHTGPGTIVKGIVLKKDHQSYNGRNMRCQRL